MSVSLSVIVPVYNVENYLHKCVDSIINQTFTDLEIILVNDGSTDSSPQICNHYAKRDNRMRVIHQQNAGVSDARNIGIALASGEYITFVDSDDYLAPEMYETMFAVAQLEAGIDIVMCDFINIKQTTKQNISSSLRAGFYSKEEIRRELYPTLLVTEDFGRIPIVSVWSCLFKSSLLKNNFILFDSQLRYSEDYLFMAEVMINSDSFYYIKGKFLYNYLQYDESRSKKFQTEWWDNLKDLNRKLGMVLLDENSFDFSRQVKLQLLHSAIFVLNKVIINKQMSFRSRIKIIKSVFDDEDLIISFRNLSVDMNSKILTIMLYLIKYKQVYLFYLFFRLVDTFTND